VIKEIKNDMATHLPAEQDVIKYFQEIAKPLLRREVARAFKIKGTLEHTEFKKMIRRLYRSGQLEKIGTRYAATHMPSVVRAKVLTLSPKGIQCAPQDAPAKTITLPYSKKLTKKLNVGDIIYVQEKNGEKARFLRIEPTQHQKGVKVIGRYHATRRFGKIETNQRSMRHKIPLESSPPADIQNGDLVSAEIFTDKRQKYYARILRRIGHIWDPSTYVQLAIEEFNLPQEFSKEALSIANQAKVPALGDREDLRHLDLVTIDGEDAKDFDDAVWAHPDDSKDNPKGWKIIVAIADVSHYVKSGNALDIDALNRGNSVYFPNYVVPMLPENLSNGLCSLRPNQDRASLVAHLRIDAQGQLISYRFSHALIQSSARLTYTQVQNFHDGDPKAIPDPLQDPIRYLYKAFHTLSRARHERGTLELDLPEPYFHFNDNEEISDIFHRERKDSHRLIEELMILANVAAARFLEDHQRGCMYRVHPSPPEDRIYDLKTFLTGLKINFPKQITPKTLNSVLDQGKATPHKVIIQELVLRSQAQAYYSPENLGHFGLNLERYAHFTSPIRRYADLIVHRFLSDAIKNRPQETSFDLTDIGRTISSTERNAISAERSTHDRMMTAFLQEKVGQRYTGVVTGVSKIGLFVSLDTIPVTGLIHVKSLKGFYHLVETTKELISEHNKRSFKLGDLLVVKLSHVDPLKGIIDFHLAS